MLQRLLVLTFLALVLPTGLAAESVDEVIAKHIEARGGMEKIRAVETLKATGTVTAQGVSLPFVLQRKRPNLYHFAGKAQGLRVVQAFDGESAWWVNPTAGVAKPQVMPEALAQVVESQVHLDGILIDYQAKGHKVELVGKERLEEGRAYKLKVTLRNGLDVHVFLDTKDYLERKHVTKAAVQGTEREVEVRFSNYESVGGVLFPRRQISMAGGAAVSDVVVETIEVGLEIEDEVFLLPGQRAMRALAVDQILRRHRKARGADATDTIASLKASGTVVAQGFEVPMALYFKRPRSFRVDVDLQGLEMVQAFDGEMAWRVSPMEGIPEPEPMPEDAQAAVAAFSDFVWGLLTGDPEDQPPVELVGIERVDRDEVYHLRLTPESGSAQNVYLGGEDFLEHKLSFPAGATAMDVFLSDFRLVSGTQLPHSIISQADGAVQFQLKIQDVEVNAEIDESIFRMPVKEEPEEQASEKEPGS